MIIRPCTAADIPLALDIIQQVQAEFCRKGINQWQDGYPALSDLEKDLSRGYAYIIEQEQQPVGYFALCFCDDPFYTSIYDGAWLCAGPYGVVHRLAVLPSMRRKGLAQAVLEYSVQEARKQGMQSLRVDTHEQNTPTLNLLNKNGFTPCGTIFVRKHGKRAAFEKLI